MSIETSLSLFFSMAILAAIPSISVLTIVGRSVAFGVRHGVYSALGILAADLLFVLIALWGLVLLTEVLGDAFKYFKYLAGVYLIFAGFLLVRTHTVNYKRSDGKGASLVSSFMTGLFITLGDQKAIVFYFGFFPAFINLQSITAFDSVVILAITLLSVGGVKIMYAVFAARLGQLQSREKMYRYINILAAIILSGVGGFLLIFS